MNATATEVDYGQCDPVTELVALQGEINRRRRIALIRAALPLIFLDYLLPARYKGAWGGRGSAKSWSFATLVILYCILRPGTRVVCIREVQRSLGQSVKRLLEDTIKRYGVGDQFRIMSHSIETPGGGLIIFQGMQDHTAESIKSLEGFHIAWVEEAQALSQRSMDLLRPTLRADGSELWFTWNPRYATDPVDVFLRHSAPPGAIIKQINYSDNPYLPKVLRDELEWDRSRDIEKFNHIWLGAYERNSEARVFKNWRIEEFETPAGVAFLFGGDWGFATDPTVGGRLWIDGRRLYVDAEVYKVGCDIDYTPALFDSLGCRQEHEHAIPCTDAKGSVVEHPAACTLDHSNPSTWPRREDCIFHHDPCLGSHCDGMARSWTITADSARPETISYMQRHGYPKVEPARKGPGSVEEGINFLKSYDIIVHPRCRHAIDELTHYSFKAHPLTGLVIPVLQDKKNHVIDMLRYAVEPVRVPVPEKEWATW